MIYHAITTDEPQLRYPCSWAGAALIEGRAAMSDAEWIALGTATDDADYIRQFNEKFNVDIS